VKDDVRDESVERVPSRLVIRIDMNQLETILREEKTKHAHWVSLDKEFLRFTPVLKPFLLPCPDLSFNSQNKDVQVVFKTIDPIFLSEFVAFNFISELPPIRSILRKWFGTCVGKSSVESVVLSSSNVD
jgi:hypothetical protein